MKKFLLILMAILITNVQVLAADSSQSAQNDNIAILTKKGFFNTPKQTCSFSPYDEIRKTFALHSKYSNGYNFENLKNLYAPNYVSSDGFTRNVYFDLVGKTRKAYPDIKYKLEIKNITINDNTAAVEVHEIANATTISKSGIVNENGNLESISDSIYYLEKINNEWLVMSDAVLFEQTSLKYGSAKDLDIKVIAPIQIQANTHYTTTLKMLPPKDCFVIASIGHENITYPQTIAEEVFRKLPEDGILERVTTSNAKNLNEYAVASFGITKAEIKNGREIKIYVTGLGFAMSRVNVIPPKVDVQTEVKVSDNGENK